jgi:hypothetical protein
MGPTPSPAFHNPPTPPEDTFFFGPIGCLGFADFNEIYRRSVKGFTHGKIIASATVKMSNATLSLIVPQLFAEILITGFTNGVAETLVYGASGMQKSNSNAYSASDFNMDAPPVQTTWDDSFAFDEIAVSVRMRGNGGYTPFNTFSAAGWATSTGDALTVDIAGKVWR